MTKKIALNLVCLVIVVCLLFSAVVFADDEVGVKEGQWIEYRVTSSGVVPEGHDVTWIRLEVVDVEGKNVSTQIVSTYSDGEMETKNDTWNLETDNVKEGFIIPANLNAGKTLESNEGNLTVNDVKEETYAGANRNIVFANNSQTQFSWDRSTGVLVEADSSYPTFAIVTKIERTNMWQAQIFGIDPFVFSVPIIATVIAVLAFFMIRKVKK